MGHQNLKDPEKDLQFFSLGSKKYSTVNKACRPQTTSFNLLMGDQPNPSILCCLSNDRQTSPTSVILGCHKRVRHFTVGGYK